MIGTAVESVVGIALLVLPGLGVRTIGRLRFRSPVDEFVYGIALSPIVAAAVGVLLLGTSTFSPTRAAVLLGVPALVGSVRGARIVMPGVRRPMAWLAAALAVPFAWTTTLAGAPPARTFQWYYWNLGTQISKAGGIPSSVREYGRSIRWLPDYVVFNVLSEAYHALSPVGTPTEQVVALRIPLALLGALTCFLMFRLWLSRPAALVSVAVLGPSTWFVLKFNAYKPEAYGAVLGVVAVILVVSGLRRAQRPMVVVGGALLGVDLAVHAIAASAFMGLTGVAAVVELVAMRGGIRRPVQAKRDRARRGWISTFAAGAVGVLLLVAIGWTLQGRALVFADAGHPARGVDGSDPTLVYSRYSSGDFRPHPTIDLHREVAQGVLNPWADLTLSPLAWSAVGGFVVVGVGLAIRTRSRRPARFFATLVGFATLLVASAVWSAVMYDTYVPRHTGLSRLAQYSPLVLAGLIGIAIDGYLRAVVAARHRPASRRAGLVVGYGLGVIVIVGSSAVTLHQIRDDSPIRPNGEAALAFLARHVAPRQVIVANVGTRGLVTFRTGASSLLEGRQPFLESAQFLDASNRVFARAHAFFTAPAAPDAAPTIPDAPTGASFVDRYHVDWIIVAADPAELGAVNSYGLPAPGWSPPGFTLSFERPGIRVYGRTTREHLAPAAVGPAQSLSGRTAITVVGLGLTAITGLWWARRRSQRVPPVRATNAQ